MANMIPKQIYIENNEVYVESAIDTKRSADEIGELLKEQLGSCFRRFQYSRGQKTVTGVYENDRSEKTYFIIANITFMGGQEGQHPATLKRIQYNQTWKDFYDEFRHEGKVLWMGLYSYKDINVWTVFEPESYLKKHEGKRMISKGGFKAQYSCHVFLNDLYQGHINQYYEKTDKNGNKLITINYSYLKHFLDGDEIAGNPILGVIEEINKTRVEWNKWIRADRAISYMKRLKAQNGFSQWKQNMWNGWLIEAVYSEFLYNGKSPFIDYIATSTSDIKKEYKDMGLDLAFPKIPYRFIGDLKAVCEGDSETLLNHAMNVENALKKFKRVWFVIYLHDKQQGKTNDYEMVKWRNRFIRDEGEWDPKKPYNELSAKRTPHSIAYTEMVVIELNEVTKDKYFTIGAQWGKNSDGKERNDKYKIDKKYLKAITDDEFVIYRYKP